MGLLAMLTLGWAVGSGSTPVDDWVTARVRDVLGSNPRWLLIFTSGWLVLAVLIACFAVAMYRRHWRLSAAVVLCPFIAMRINSVLKRLFDRHNGSYLEYPSGHTTLLVAAVGMLVVVATGRRWAVVIAATVTGLGALGLVACGYHYPTDTIGSILLASSLVCVAALLAGGSRPSVASQALAAVAVACATGVGTGAVSYAAPGDARAAGLVDIRSVVPGALVDLRYATPNNFLHMPLYPPDAHCLVHESLASGLATAAEVLRRQGRTLVFWDCYRPHPVQVKMFEAIPDPTWVARPGPFARSHTAGRSVDVTVADSQRRLVDMGTDFDDFSPRAAAFATAGISTSAAANRAVLRNAMTAGGLAPYSSEWWHFDGPGAGVERPILDVSVNS